MESMVSMKKKENTTPPYWEMGQRIVAARTSLTDMNQSEMTRALGLSEPTYGNYERGTRRMPPDIMEKFHKLTGCLADYIYRGQGPMSAYSQDMNNASEVVRNTAEQELLNAFRGLDDSAKSMYLHSLKTFKTAAPGDKATSQKPPTKARKTGENK